MKKYISLALCGLLCFTAAAGCGAEDLAGTTTGSGADGDQGEGAAGGADAPPATAPTAPPDPSIDSSEAVQATITMEDGGVIVLELYPHVAPQSVYNFIYLARQGFYDGLKFHRIMYGFMIQGGCPLGLGYGNPGYSIVGEFNDNGFTNDLKHTRGVLSMARSSDYNSAGSQFFIMHDAAPSLDGSYAAFGRVISGMDVVDRIADIPNDGPNGSVADEDKPVMASVTIDSNAEFPEPDKLPN